MKPTPLTSPDAIDPLSGGLLLILFGLIAVLVYFIPFGIALYRSHPYVWPLFLVNLVFGVTGVGWVGVLIWSVWPRRNSVSVLVTSPLSSDFTGPALLQRPETLPLLAAPPPLPNANQPPEPASTNSRASRVCPQCRQVVPFATRFCPFCREDLNPGCLRLSASCGCILFLLLTALLCFFIAVMNPPGG
jgi:hypothetical protein